ncbi:MAG: hypothetical protein ABSG17_04705 [Spirochaetia bacterium]|jgi:hypothetical protein
MCNVDWGTMRAAAIFAFSVVGGFTLSATDRPPVSAPPDAQTDTVTAAGTYTLIITAN